MNIRVKIFPIAGLCEKTQEMELSPGKGSLEEALGLLREQLGADGELCEIESLMLLHNGRVLDKRSNAVFRDGDELWLLPLLSGG